MPLVDPEAGGTAIAHRCAMPTTRRLLFPSIVLSLASCTSIGVDVREDETPMPRDGACCATDPLPIAPAKAPLHRRTGPWELTLGGAGVSNKSVRAGSAQVAGSLGYFLNENFELSVRQNSAYGNAGPGSPEVWDNTSRAALDFHLPIGDFVPYAGVNFGYAYGDGIPDSLVGGPEAGAKVFFKDDVFVLFAVEYQAFFDSSDDASSVFDDAQLIYGISLGVRF